jgi:hypothetical protein
MPAEDTAAPVDSARGLNAHQERLRLAEETHRFPRDAEPAHALTGNRCSVTE